VSKTKNQKTPKKKKKKGKRTEALVKGHTLLCVFRALNWDDQVSGKEFCYQHGNKIWLTMAGAFGFSWECYGRDDHDRIFQL
jgi:hypothetical protein